MSALQDFIQALRGNQIGATPGKPPKLTLDQDDLDKIPHRDVVSRAKVEEDLRKWLEELHQSTKRQFDTMESTDIVWQIDTRLHEGLPGPPNSPVTKQGGIKGTSYTPADLASKIAGSLPDDIPRVNLVNALKLKPKDAPADESLKDKALKKLDEKADQVLADFKVPKQYWQKVKDAVKKHTPDLLDKLPIDSTMKDLLKKAYDQLTKEPDA